MKTYYDLIDNIYTYLNGNENVTTVTFGDIMEVDLSKQSIFPLSHVNVNDVTFSDHTMTFGINVIVMDIVDENKDDKQSEALLYRGLDNKQDILNTMLTVVNGLQSSLRRGGMQTNNYELLESANATLFQDRFENLLTGWSLVINIEVPNTEMALINANGGSCL